MSRKLPHALYGRTSKDDPRRVTIELQQKALREWATRDPLVSSIEDEYWDAGISGKIPLGERPEGARLLADVKAGRVAAVAVVYVDRFGRTLLDGLQAAAELEKQGVKLIVVNDGIDQRREDSRLTFQFRLMLAEEEHRRIKERMHNGRLRAMDRDNAPPGGPITFGYTMDARGQFVVNQEQAPIVIRIFEMVLQGYSNTATLAWVKSTGIPAGHRKQKRTGQPFIDSKGGDWSLKSIGKILRNRTYIGERKWGERTFPCPPLVDVETFERVQALCRDRCKRQLGLRGPSKGMLSGLLQCGLCGNRFYHRGTAVRRKSGKLAAHRHYVCNGARVAIGCKAKALAVEKTDEAVWKIIEAYLRDPEAILRQACAADRKLGGTVADLAAREEEANARLAAIDQEIKDTWAEKDARGWSMAMVAPRIDAINARREDELAAIAAIRREQAALQLDRDSTQMIVAQLAGIRIALWEGVSEEDKHRIARLILAGGIVHTAGEGSKKSVSLSLRLRWGDVSCRKVPEE